MRIARHSRQVPAEVFAHQNAALKRADEIIERTKPDAILASYPVVEALEIGVALSEKYGLPLISDFRDGLLFEPLEVAAQQHNAVRHHYEALEARVVAASKLILTVSEPISAYFRERYAQWLMRRATLIGI